MPRKPNWNTSATKAIRVPAHLADTLLAFARSEDLCDSVLANELAGLSQTERHQFLVRLAAAVLSRTPSKTER